MTPPVDVVVSLIKTSTLGVVSVEVFAGKTQGIAIKKRLENTKNNFFMIYYI
jgi:hypothetical protein